MILRQFRAIWEKLFFQPKKCQNTQNNFTMWCGGFGRPWSADVACGRKKCQYIVF